MAKPETAYSQPLVCVVSDSFCLPYAIDLVVKKKVKGISDLHFDVLDVNGNLHLQVDGHFLQLQKKRIMRDPSGYPILTMREKVLAFRHRWSVHRGESSDAKQFLYSVQRSHTLQIKTQLDVFLATDAREDVCDFHVVGSYSDQSFRVYNKGETLIAEVKDDSSLGNFLLKGKESFGVRVYPGVDYAFIVSLLVILNENDVL